MSVQKRKYPNVSIITIMGLGPKVWRKKLCEAARQRNLEFLVSLQYGIQADMTDLAKRGQSNPNIEESFLRISGSINRAIKETARKNNKPMPNIKAYEKLAAKRGISINSDEAREAKSMFTKQYREKKEQDVELEKFIKSKSF